MKIKAIITSLMVLAALAAIAPKAPALEKGDIAIVEFNIDTTTKFAFVALEFIPQGTVIYFTDRG